MMTLEAFLMQNGGTIIAAVILAVPGMLGAYWSKRGITVSRGNADALSVVRDKQDQNRDAITATIDSVKHDLKNGAGDVIASKVERKIQPKLDAITKTTAEAAAVIEVAATTAAQKVVDKADEVATALGEAKAWDGENRRTGPDDRRQPDDKPK